MTPTQTRITFLFGPFDGETIDWCHAPAPPEGTECEMVSAPNVKALYRFERGAWRYQKSWREHKS